MSTSTPTAPTVSDLPSLASPVVAPVPVPTLSSSGSPAQPTQPPPLSGSAPSPATAPTSVPAAAPATAPVAPAPARPPSTSPPVGTQPFNPAQPVAGPSRPSPSASNPAQLPSTTTSGVNGTGNGNGNGNETISVGAGAVASASASTPGDRQLPFPTDPAALRARIALAQQAMQASMQRQTEAAAADGQGQGQNQQQSQQQQQQGQPPPPSLPLPPSVSQEATDGQGQGLGQGSTDGGVRRTSGPQSGSNPTQDWAVMASAMGMLNNMPGATTSKEAMMKQLQALTNTHAQRARLAGNAAVTPGGNPQGSPAAANVAPSPSALSVSSPAAPTPTSGDQAASASASTPNSSNPPLPGASQPGAPGGSVAGVSQLPPPPPGGMTMEHLSSITPQQREFLLQQQRARAAQLQQQQQQQRPPQTMPQPQQSAPSAASPAPGTQAAPIATAPSPSTVQQPTATSRPSAPSQPSLPNPTQPPAARPGPPAARSPQVTEQRKQFLHSLTTYHKQNNIPLHPDVFNGEQDGAVKMGDYWVELVEVFMTVMRSGGISNVMKQGQDSPAWQALITAKGIPNPLPQPVQLPRPANADESLPVTMTNNPIQFILAAYLAYLQGFEQHMSRHRQAAALHRQHQQATQAALAAGRPPPPPPMMANGAGAGAPVSASSPAQAPTPGAPTPTASAPSPAVIAAAANASSPAAIGTAASYAVPPSPMDAPTPPTALGRPPSRGKPKDGGKPTPAPIRTDAAPSPATSIGTPTADGVLGKKRKKDRKSDGRPRSAIIPDAGTPTTLPTPVISAPLPEPERPPTPKRARYKVEYRPLHHPQPSLAGWDERAVASTFPKHMLGHPSRSIHELGLVDMEAILMGIRSRLPRELGYALTVLSMLSMPHPEENIGGLPLFHAQEIYLELLELISEAAFGEEGYDAWAKDEAQSNPSATGGAVGADAGGDLNRMSWIELEQLGRDFDFSFDLDALGLDVQIPTKKERDHTGGSTDIILTGLNLLRNFSMMPENHATMAQVPDLFHLLGRISDARLARLPGQSGSGGSAGSAGSGDKPFSILELARVRRDCVTILTNLGGIVDLRKVSSDSVVAVFRLLSTFLTSGWESLHHRESPFGPTPSIRDAPPPVILSINRAVEAWCKLAQSDSNREILSRVPADELVALFEGLVRLFPVDRRGFEAMHTVEDFLGFTECLALSCYSLAFLSPLSVRASMRSIPGITNVLMRIIFQTAPAGQRGDFKNNPFNVLCRRVCEILGVLNGTVSASGDVETMGFSAGSGGEGNGTGWTFRSRPVEKAWLAGYGENLVGAMMIKGMDLPAFEELDGLWWAGNEEI